MKVTNKIVPIRHGKVSTPTLSVASRNKQRLRRSTLSMRTNLSGGPRHKEIETDRISDETLNMLAEAGYIVQEYAGSDINGNPVYVNAGNRKHTPVEDMPEVSFKEPIGKPKHIKPVQPDSASGKGARRFSGRATDPIFYTSTGNTCGKERKFKSDGIEFGDSYNRPEFKAPRVSHSYGVADGVSQRGLLVDQTGKPIADPVRTRLNERGVSKD